MAALVALALLAASAGTGSSPQREPTASAGGFTPTAAVSSTATVSVRILPGVQVRLGQSADSGANAYSVSTTRVYDETGAKRAAKLVEFQ